MGKNRRASSGGNRSSSGSYSSNNNNADAATSSSVAGMSSPGNKDTTTTTTGAAAAAAASSLLSFSPFNSNNNSNQTSAAASPPQPQNQSSSSSSSKQQPQQQQQSASSQPTVQQQQQQLLHQETVIKLTPELEQQLLQEYLHQQGKGTGTPPGIITLQEWLTRDRQGFYWVMGCFLLSFLFGCGLGVGTLQVPYLPPGPWRQNLANSIRSSKTYQFATLQGPLWDDVFGRYREWSAKLTRVMEAEGYAQNPSHPHVFAVLREAIVREKGGYVYDDLGFLVPAPCGAARGLGMVSDQYYQCQSRCIPGTPEEEHRMSAASRKTDKHTRRKSDNKNSKNNNNTTAEQQQEEQQRFSQPEVLIRVPLGFQMTRKVALETLQELIPADRKPNLNELDDAALLTLLLAHERGRGRYSRWLAYIASLPTEPSCGYSKPLRPYMLDAIQAMRDEYNVHVEGWTEELIRATQTAQKIAENLARDYGPYIQTPTPTTTSSSSSSTDKGDASSSSSSSSSSSAATLENIQWALCHVASRAIAGSTQHGALRMVPLVDCINHDISAGAFMELSGQEKITNGDLVDATEDESGTFVVQSLYHGMRKPLRKGQELLANYNVPNLSPLDWMVSTGFVPRERRRPFTKIDAVFPRVRGVGASFLSTSAATFNGFGGGDFANGDMAEAFSNMPTEQAWKMQEALTTTATTSSQQFKTSEL